ncbi:hypothetical protein KSC_044180 [Ktedonobacter sp. SOSP1-52]|nr:hypothetical protein KSC_044180 [Ktedonobacter sp. SOSP1-52]
MVDDSRYAKVDGLGVGPGEWTKAVDLKVNRRLQKNNVDFTLMHQLVWRVEKMERKRRLLRKTVDLL